MAKGVFDHLVFLEGVRFILEVHDINVISLSYEHINCYWSPLQPGEKKLMNIGSM